MRTTCVIGMLSLACALASAADDYRAAILDDPSLPAADSLTPVDTFRAVLAAEEVPLTSLNADQIANTGVLNADAFELLIVPTGASFPAEARDALLAFLERGGDLFCTGGYAFDSLWIKRDEQWVSSHDEWLRQRELARNPETARIPNGGFETESQHWETGSPQACRVVADGAFAGQSCGQISNVGLGDAVAWETPLEVRPGVTFLIGAHAKTDPVQGPGFAFLAVYQYDAQGALVKFIDFAQLRTATDWTRHETSVEIAPNAAHVVLRAGFYQAVGTLWIDEATCAPLPHETLINAHYGKPEDGLILDPRQLMLFNPEQRFAGESWTHSPQGPLSPNPKGSPQEARVSPSSDSSLAGVRGTILGFEATAQLGGEARWIPLIEAHDKYDRFSGVPGALVFHTAPPFKHSVWALFGVTNRDLFDGEEGRQLLRDTMRILRTGVFIESVKTVKPIYEPGENASIQIVVSNTSSSTKTVGLEASARSICLSKLQRALSSQNIEIAKRDSASLSVTVEYDAFYDAGIMPFTARVEVNGLAVDKQEGGYSIPHYVLLSGGVACVGYQPKNIYRFGTDTFCNVFISPSHSPLTWYRDSKMMYDYGLHMFENLQMTPPDYVYTNEFELQLDSFTSRARESSFSRLGYMAGLLIGQDIVVSDTELRQQAAMCQRFAAEHKNWKDLTYYLNGDFQLTLKDIPDIKRLWNTFLSARYANDDALRAAWNPPPNELLGGIPVKDWPAQTWYDVHARDVALFKTELMKRWIGALCKAIRLEDQVHPITSEYYQRPFNGIDLRLTVGDMDVANFGYFDEPKRDVARLMATIKWNDMRRTGKGCNIGEFGVKTHDAWAPEHGGSGYQIRRTDDERNALYWWMAHAALGMGVSKIQSWCWSDDPDRVFPWGMAYTNPLRPKPVLKLYRNLRMLASQIEPSYRLSNTELVLPDTWRLGAPEAMAHASLMNAIECLLATNEPFDVANEADLIGMGVVPPEKIVMPLAYALDDASFAALLEAAERGARVYLSGDPSITPDGKRDPARLEKAFGVKFQHEATHASGLPYPVVEGLPEKVAQPSPSAIYPFARGKGQIFWSPEPWETLPGKDPFVADVALTGDPANNGYLSLVNCFDPYRPAPLQTPGGQWRILDESGPMVFFPRSPIEPGTRVETVLPKIGGHIALTLLPREALPALIHCNREEHIVLATGTGSLTADDGTYIDGVGAWMAFSLDKKSLRGSTRLAVASTSQGPISWNSSVADLRAWMVEWQGGIGRVVAPIPLTHTEKGWAIDVEPNELYVIAQEEPSDDVFDTLRNGPQR